MNKMNNIVGLKELRENTENYVAQIKKGKSFIVIRRSEPLFKISPLEEAEELWETVVDFTKIKKGGIEIGKILSRL